MKKIIILALALCLSYSLEVLSMNRKEQVSDYSYLASIKADARKRAFSEGLTIGFIRGVLTVKNAVKTPKMNEIALELIEERLT